MPENNRRLLTPEEIETGRRLLLAMVSGVGGKEILESLVGKVLTPSHEDGLFELVAPDGILVKVVDRRIGLMELQNLIRADISSRMLRNTFVRMIEEGKSDEEISALTFPKFLEVKRGYRLEKLPNPR